MFASRLIFMNGALINVVFKIGKGILTANLFRHGEGIETHTLETSGQIHISTVNTGDVLSISGASLSGPTEITIFNSDGSTVQRIYSTGSFVDNFTASDVDDDSKTSDTGPRFW